jgi:30S ribosomal protein 3
VAAAAAAQQSIEADGAVDDLEEETPEEATTAQAGTSAAKQPEPALKMDHCLNVLWMEKNVALAVDQTVAKDMRSPVTEYYFWPRTDAWEDMKAGLETKPWIPEREKIELLNNLTDIITAWESNPRPGLEEVQKRFPAHHFRS